MSEPLPVLLTVRIDASMPGLASFEVLDESGPDPEMIASGTVMLKPYGSVVQWIEPELPEDAADNELTAAVEAVADALVARRGTVT